VDTSFDGCNRPGGPSSWRSRVVLLVAVGSAVLALIPNVASAAAPTVTIDPAVTPGYTTAQVFGTVDPADEETYYSFEYSADPATEGWSGFRYEGPISAGAGTQNVSVELTGLTLATEYQVRLATRNAAESVEAFSDQPNPTFTTKSVGQPTLSVAAATGVTPHSVILHGQITPNAPESAPTSPAVEAAFEVHWHFECTPGCPGAEGVVAADDVAHPVMAEVSGLLSGRSYEFRLVGENAAGPKSSAPEIFSTPADGPVVGRGYATSVGATAAEIGAKINPEGAQTSYRFQYASLANFDAHGFSAAGETAETLLGTGNADLAGVAAITGLSPGVTYVYRAIASNAVETVIGSQAELRTRPSSSPVSGGCPNEALRAGHSAALPDCRAYEQVTPVDKSNQDGVYFNGSLFNPSVSVGGNRAAYFSFGSFAGSPAPNPFYLATSGPTGWSSEGIIPRQSTQHGLITVCAPQYRAYSSDLSRGILEDGFNPFFLGCGSDEPPLVPDEPEGFQNLFLRDNTTGTYQLINVTPPGVTPADAAFQGASPDLRHVVFDEPAPLTPDAASGNMLYEWSAGSVKLIGLVPLAPATSCSGSECAPVEGARIGGEESGVGLVANAVSDDGSRVFFRAGGDLYLRDGDTTTQVDVSHGPDPSGGGQFWTAAADASSVFFTDTRKLTGDSTATGSSPDLYRYDAGSGNLTDLTVDTTDVNGADVLGVVGAGENASYLYFVADGVLTTTPNSHGVAATAGQPNLYVLHEGTTTFIGTMAPTFPDNAVWNGTAQYRLSPDGTELAFNSIRSLTGYDNTDANTGDPDSEIFLYQAESNSLVCASCNPTGARPIGDSRLEAIEFRLRNFEPSGPNRDNFSLPRNLSENGNRLFFNSSDALVPTDTNGRQDVYEYENGRAHLISTGEGGDNSLFYGASASGDDVFFITRDRLVGQDTDGFTDLYDARVDGGIAAQNPPSSSSPCSGDACKGSSTAAPADQSPGSSSFSGPGNQRQVGKPGCKRTQGNHKKCANKPHKKKHKKKPHKQGKYKKSHEHEKHERRRAK
jgi:hypothetical protein